MWRFGGREAGDLSEGRLQFQFQLLPDSDAQVDDASVTIGRPGGLQSQTRLVGCRQAVVDPVVRVACVATAAGAIRALSVNRVRQSILEEKLRGELVRLRRSREQPQLEMDVNGTSTIPPRVYRRKRCDAVRIRDLITA